ncbi:MAG: aspartate aminotransferase family protein [Planctomycetaceae bacterium]|nr:aspartate aminotransferase family protein [Planctomycetaceae bacterium]|tara:strand:+ start:998 stop:2422 length:1425 start_codon:yes stop_codon:yes gene_type:complete
MTPDDFRQHGREVIDWIADYMEQVEQYPVLSRVAPGDIRTQLPDSAPLQGESFDQILDDVNQVILPGITHWQSPNFFGYYPANTSPPSILGELLAAGLGVQGMLWTTSPACTELEQHVLDWLIEMLDLPEQFLSTGNGGGVIQDTASSATLCALLAACYRGHPGDTPRDTRRLGLDSWQVAYTSDQAHSSVEKSMMIAGMGTDRLRVIESDQNWSMRPDLLAQQMAADATHGLKPTFVCATVGTTSSGAIDPLPEIGAICRDHGAWLHVDAAMAGTAAICPEFRQMHAGLELADSYAFNPHKWMFVNFDCDCFYVADRQPLLQALSVLPDYLRNRASQSGEVVDFRDWHIPLGRRFRALKLWFVIRSFGVEGLQKKIRAHVEWATRFAEWIEADQDFELAAPRSLNLVCFRHVDGDEVNQKLLDAVNDSGDLFLTHTTLDGQLTLRFSIAQTSTRLEHVERAWAAIQGTAAELL